MFNPEPSDSEPPVAKSIRRRERPLRFNAFTLLSIEGSALFNSGTGTGAAGAGGGGGGGGAFGLDMHIYYFSKIFLVCASKADRNRRITEI
jgi:hypothetical protein